jgi:hypothetical protein
MKRVIKLTESDLTRIVKRVMVEQGFLGGLEAMPETGQDVIGVGPGGTLSGDLCEVRKTSGELTLELFSRLRGLSGQPSQTDKSIQSWVTRLNTSMSGAGITDDLIKVLNQIKTPQQMGAVLIAYNNKYKRTLHKDLSGEYTISWETIWGSLKKFAKGLKLDSCKRYKTTSA